MNTKSVSGWTFLIFEPLEDGTSRLGNQGTVIRELGERLLVTFVQPAKHSRIISAEEAANLVLFPSVEKANEFLGVVFNRSANEAPPDKVPPAPESDEDSYKDPYEDPDLEDGSRYDGDT